MTSPHIVLARFLLASTDKLTLTGGQRNDYLEAVWQMYRTSYEKIGMHLSGANDLLDYDQWDVFVEDDRPVAFVLNKGTPSGYKLGLAGSDGSGEGKGIIKAQLKTIFSKSGYYGEVSHAVEKLSAGAPVVCAIYVPKVLNKVILPTEDGVHYQRKLEGLGMVTKKMVGQPRGVPSGDEGSCPTPEKPGEPMGPGDVKLSMEKQARETRLASAEHAFCQLDLGDELERNIGGGQVGDALPFAHDGLTLFGLFSPGGAVHVVPHHLDAAASAGALPVGDELVEGTAGTAALDVRVA